MNKANLYAEKYREMRNGVIAHAEHASPNNPKTKKKLGFVFIASDDNSTQRRLILELQAEGMAFIDVGMGIERTDDKLLEVVRTSINTTRNRFRQPQFRKFQAELTRHEKGENKTEIYKLWN